MSDAVNHPPHYKAGQFEPIDVIEDWKLGFCLGNVVKYIARAEHKGATITDLEKARWYLDREIQQRKAVSAAENPSPPAPLPAAGRGEPDDSHGTFVLEVSQ